VLNRLRTRVDNRRYNGAALLGLRGVVIKSHGSADVYAYGFALQRAREAVVSKLLERTAQTVAQITKRVQSGDVPSAPPQNVAGDTA
jgi:glycerol-3-phosphate acyltransferase PlsX